VLCSQAHPAVGLGLRGMAAAARRGREPPGAMSAQVRFVFFNTYRCQGKKRPCSDATVAAGATTPFPCPRLPVSAPC
jgi:hypothetical protein